MGFGTFSLNETGSSSRSMQIFLFRSSLMQPRVRVLERVYFIHAAHTVHSIRAVIKFYFRQLCVYAFHGSLWKYAGNSYNNTQTHANAPLYSLPPLPLPVPRALTRTRQRSALLALFEIFRNRQKRKFTRSFDLRLRSINFHPFLSLVVVSRKYSFPWKRYIYIYILRKNTYWIVNELVRASRVRHREIYP